MKSSWLHMLGPSTVAILAQSPPPLQSLTFFSLGFQPLDVIGPSDIMQLVGYCPRPPPEPRIPAQRVHQVRVLGQEQVWRFGRPESHSQQKPCGNFPIQFGDNITWVPTVRWVVDGNIWSSSGISAGIDMTYAFVTMLLGPELAGTVIKVLEYEPRTEQNWDPYPVVHNIPGAETCRSLGECVGPAGYEFGCGKEEAKGNDLQLIMQRSRAG